MISTSLTSPVATCTPALRLPDPDLLNNMRSFGVSVNIVPDERGVILEGISNSYYGKQMAQELARKANLVVVRNRIRVARAV